MILRLLNRLPRFKKLEIAFFEKSAPWYESNAQVHQRPEDQHKRTYTYGRTRTYTNAHMMSDMVDGSQLVSKSLSSIYGILLLGIEGKTLLGVHSQTTQEEKNQNFNCGERIFSFF